METKKPETKSYVPLSFVERKSAKNPSTKPESQREASLGPPEIPHDEFIIETYLGEGAFGKVYKGTCRGKTVAIKEPIKQDLDIEEMEAFQHEVQIMSRLFHPNICMYMGGCVNPDKSKFETIKICMEFCETDVEILLSKDRKARKILEKGSPVDYKPLTMRERIQLCKDAALGMNWLHGINSIVHGDLKTANLLIDSNGKVKVADFGFAKIKKADLTKDPYPVGTPVYMAPEVMLGKEYDGFKADIYSFGLILWEIATSEKLFPEFKQWKPFKKAITEDKIRPTIPEFVSSQVPGLVLLMRRCWAEDPAERPSFAEILFRLDEILVDVCITDDLGRDFWKRHFLLPKQSLDESVPWGEFKEILLTEIAVSAEDVKAVKPLLAKTIDEVHEKKKCVTMEHFNAMIHTFGYFFLPKFGPKTIREMKDLLNKDYFHGDIDRAKAVQRLASGEEGSWLLRLRDPLDAKYPGFPFAISQIKDKKPIQRLIKYDPTKDKKEFIIPVKGKDRPFGSIDELVACPDLKLKKPADKNDEVGYDYAPSTNDEDDINPLGN